MAELEIDQTNLPRVQEVCQCFAVLEDGALAHNLQEQEIEQYYTTNIQKNQLVQNDIRIAKRLQDEEEEQWAQQSALLRQNSRQLEERDFEYARLIQEDILRCAEEAQRREQGDEEIAIRMQEEEKQRTRRSRGQEGHTGTAEDSASDPVLPSPPQHTLSSLQQGDEQYSPATTRWQSSTSHNPSNLIQPQSHSPSGTAAQENTTSRSSQGHGDSFREIRAGLREPLSEDSEDPDTVFSERLSVSSQRSNERLNTAPPRRRASLHQPHERPYRSLCSRSSFTEELRVWEEERGECDEEDYYEDGDLERRRRRDDRKECGDLHRSRDQERVHRSGEARERRCSRSESVRLHDRNGHANRELARTWSYRDNPDKHVHFREDARSSDRQQGESGGVWEMLGHVLRERGVPVKLGSNGAPLQIRLQSRDGQVLHRSEASCGDSRPHQRAFQRASTSRHSFHGDIRGRRLSYQEDSGRDHRADRDGHHNIAEHDEEVCEIGSRDAYLANGERGGGSRKWRQRRSTEDDAGERNANDCRVKRTTSERRHWHKTVEERSSSEEEQEVERGREHPRRRGPQRSQSLSSRSSSRASTRGRSRHMAAGVSPQPEPGETRLDLGELQQVLQDEELARKLQEAEEKQLRRKSQPSPCSSYPDGDFRVAQVAQDEEIAHFMQKQEIKSKRRSRELEGPSSWREHRAMISHHDRRATRERPVHRERLDSEGLPSPTEDCSPENEPPSPTSTLPQAQQIKNIAEELDPTFQARRQGPVGQTGPCQSLPMPHSGLRDFLEEPTFIPPTKRPTDKSGRTKPKEKKENCKQQ